MRYKLAESGVVRVDMGLQELGDEVWLLVGSGSSGCFTATVLLLDDGIVGCCLEGAADGLFLSLQ